MKPSTIIVALGVAGAALVCIGCAALTRGADSAVSGVTGGLLRLPEAAYDAAVAVDEALGGWLKAIFGYVGLRTAEAGGKKAIAARRARVAKKGKPAAGSIPAKGGDPV